RHAGRRELPGWVLGRPAPRWGRHRGVAGRPGHRMGLPEPGLAGRLPPTEGVRQPRRLPGPRPAVALRRVAHRPRAADLRLLARAFEGKPGAPSRRRRHPTYEEVTHISPSLNTLQPEGVSFGTEMLLQAIGPQGVYVTVGEIYQLDFELDDMLTALPVLGS